MQGVLAITLWFRIHYVFSITVGCFFNSNEGMYEYFKANQSYYTMLDRLHRTYIFGDEIEN